jgi:hypothetical protein
MDSTDSLIFVYIFTRGISVPVLENEKRVSVPGNEEWACLLVLKNGKRIYHFTYQGVEQGDDISITFPLVRNENSSPVPRNRTGMLCPNLAIHFDNVDTNFKETLE